MFWDAGTIERGIRYWLPHRGLMLVVFSSPLTDGEKVLLPLLDREDCSQCQPTVGASCLGLDEHVGREVMRGKVREGE
jgi:hypothetical protein